MKETKEENKNVQIGSSVKFTDEIWSALRENSKIRLGNVSSRLIEFPTFYLVVGHDRSLSGMHDIYTGDFDYHHYLTIMKKDLTELANLGDFPLMYRTIWPKNSHIIKTYEEKLKDIVLKENVLEVSIEQKHYRVHTREYDSTKSTRALTYVDNQDFSANIKSLEFKLDGKYLEH